MNTHSISNEDGEKEPMQQKIEEDSLPFEFPTNEDKQLNDLNILIAKQLEPIRLKLEEVSKQMSSTESLTEIKTDVSNLKTQMQAQEEEPENWEQKIEEETQRKNELKGKITIAEANLLKANKILSTISNKIQSTQGQSIRVDDIRLLLSQYSPNKMISTEKYSRIMANRSRVQQELVTSKSQIESKEFKAKKSEKKTKDAISDLIKKSLLSK